MEREIIRMTASGGGGGQPGLIGGQPSHFMDQERDSPNFSQPVSWVWNRNPRP